MSKKYIEQEAVMNACKEAKMIGLPEWNCGIEYAQERIKDLPAADVVQRPRWIPVEQRLPEKSGNYLTAFGDGTAMAVNEFMHPRDWLTEEGRKANPNGKWYWGGVTHWMLLPELPKEEE